MNRAAATLLITAVLLAGCTDATPDDPTGPDDSRGPGRSGDRTPSGDPDGSSDGPGGAGEGPDGDPLSFVAVDCHESNFSMEAERDAAQPFLPDGYSFPGSPVLVVFLLAMDCHSASHGNRTATDDFQFAALYAFLADEEGDLDEDNVFLFEAVTSWPRLVEAANGTLPLTLGSVAVDGPTVTVDGAGTYTFTAPPTTPDEVEGGLFAVSMHAGGPLQVDLRVTKLTSNRLPVPALGQFDGGTLGALFPAGAPALHGIAQESARIDLVPSIR